MAEKAAATDVVHGGVGDSVGEGVALGVDWGDGVTACVVTVWLGVTSAATVVLIQPGSWLVGVAVAKGDTVGGASSPNRSRMVKIAAPAPKASKATSTTISSQSHVRGGGFGAGLGASAGG